MKSVFTNKLGIYGLTYLEPVILAGLVDSLPILLIGKHGSAKSYLLERLSKALNLNYKFYNASLIDYDDLVGIPVPNEDKSELKYIKTDTAIWDAEVVFIDEINRTKPELQNKLFPIIYEKRVQGKDLESLKYRWAAMNPSYELDDINYIGTMPLDEALADRFGYIIKVPSWEELAEEDKRNILNTTSLDEFYEDLDLNSLIEETRNKLDKLKDKLEVIVNEVVLNLMSLLRKKLGYISARRAQIIKEGIIDIHVARLVLNSHNEAKEEINLDDSIYLAIKNLLPQIANEEISEEMIFKLVKTALVSINFNKITFNYMSMENSIDKLIYGFKHIDEIGENVLFESLPTSFIGLKRTEVNVAAVLTLLKIRNYPNCPVAVIEALFNKGFNYFALNYRRDGGRYGRRRIYYKTVDDKTFRKVLEIKTSKEEDEARLNFLISYVYKNTTEEEIFYMDELFRKLYKEYELWI